MIWGWGGDLRIAILWMATGHFCPNLAQRQSSDFLRCDEPQEHWRLPRGLDKQQRGCSPSVPFQRLYETAVGVKILECLAMAVSPRPWWLPMAVTSWRHLRDTSGFLSILLAHQTHLCFPELHLSCAQIQELPWHLSVSQNADLVLRGHLLNFASLSFFPV